MALLASNSPTVAGVVLCLNEQVNIRRCLESLAWCDELLVVDSGSNDKTREYAEGLGARVIVHKQAGPFLITEQRNWALEHCEIKSDWVLFLDADEVLTQCCREQIHANITYETELIGFELTPRYWFLGRWLKRSQGYPNWHPRLCRRGYIHFKGGVWESFSTDKLVGRIHEPYEHYAFSKGVDDWLRRHQRYADWEAQRIVDYIDGNKHDVFISSRKESLRTLSARFWRFRPLLRFCQKYILQGGWQESWQGFVFCAMMALYEFITVLKVVEIRRLSRGLPL